MALLNFSALTSFGVGAANAASNVSQPGDFGTVAQVSSAWAALSKGNITPHSRSDHRFIMPHAGRRQLQKMRDRWLVPQRAPVYLKETNEIGKAALVTDRTSSALYGWHPTPARLVSATANLRRDLSLKGIDQIYVAGITEVGQSGEVRMGRARSARATFVLPGGIRAGDDFIELMEDRMQAYDQGLTDVLAKPMIIENDRGFWDDFLKIYQRDMTDLQFSLWLQQRGIFITSNFNETVEQAESLVVSEPLPSLEWQKKPLVPKGATVFIATATRKKYEQIKKIVERLGLDIEIRFIQQLFTYQSAEEKTQTYEGNANDKLEQAFLGWNLLSREEQDKALATLGLERDKVFFLSEDSGLRFEDHRVAESPAFQGLKHLMHDLKDFPGVETGPIGAGTYGWPMVFKEAGLIQDEVERDGGEFSQGMFSTAVVALSPLDQSRTVVMTSSIIRGEWKRQSSSERTAQIEDFFCPGAGDKTERECGNEYFHKLSARARAIKALADLVGLKPVPGLNRDHYDYKGSFQALSMGLSLSEQASTVPELQASVDRHLNFNPGRLNRLEDVERLFFDPGQALVLFPDPKTFEQDFWRNLFVFVGPLVGRHTYDMHLVGKPFALFDPSGRFEPIRRLIYDLHVKGTVPEELEELFDYIRDPKKLATFLKTGRSDYLVFNHRDYGFNESGSREGQPDFITSVFLSSVNRNERMLQNAISIVDANSQSGRGTRSGAGYEGGMGELTRAATWRRRNGLWVWHDGASVPNVMEGPMGEGNVIDQLDYFVQMPNIYRRMEFLLQAHSFITDIGGPGTLQELAAWAWLKSRALANPNDAYIQSHFPHIARSKMFLINTQIDKHDPGQRFWDYFISIIPEGEMKRLGLVVVPNVEVANRLNDDFQSSYG